MGWLKLGAKTQSRSQPSDPEAFHQDLKWTTQYIETVFITPQKEAAVRYPFAGTEIEDERLPFIPAEVVKKRKSAEEGGLYIVVDKIVYDCTDFLTEHPGGGRIIKSFAGAECSWQFWRFHGKREMEEFGRPLRVGRTEGMVNKYKEPVRYVGLRRLGDDAWD